MDKKNLIKIINKELTIVTDILHELEHAEHMHPFEIDLAISRVKDIYGELLLLKDDSKPVNQDLNPDENKAFIHSDENRTKRQTGTPNAVNDTVKEQKVSFADTDCEVNLVENNGVETPDKENTKLPGTDIDKMAVSDIINDDNSEEITANVKVDENLDEPIEKVEESMDRASASDNNIGHKMMPEPEIDEPERQENKADVKSGKEVDKKVIIADKYNNTLPSVNDMLAGIKSNKDLASCLGDRPIESMKKAVKLNDKIWYINELFNRDADLYNATINRVDAAKDLDEALAVFSEFQWDQEKKSTISFLELVFRRFAN